MKKAIKKAMKIVGITFGVIVALFIVIGIIANTTTSQPKAAVVKHVSAADLAKQKQAAELEHEQQVSELQSLGDWDISSQQQTFQDDYNQVQSDLNNGDVQSAYSDAQMFSSYFDQQNSDVMNNQDMKNVPADIPSNVRNELSNVDPQLTEAYMAYKMVFDDLADYANSGDMSKLSDVQTNIQIANDDFNTAKGFINKANQMIK